MTPYTISDTKTVYRQKKEKGYFGDFQREISYETPKYLSDYAMGEIVKLQRQKKNLIIVVKVKLEFLFCKHKGKIYSPDIDTVLTFLPLTQRGVERFKVLAIGIITGVAHKVNRVELTVVNNTIQAPGYTWLAYYNSMLDCIEG